MFQNVFEFWVLKGEEKKKESFGSEKGEVRI